MLEQAWVLPICHGMMVQQTAVGPLFCNRDNRKRLVPSLISDALQVEMKSVGFAGDRDRIGKERTH